MADRSTMKRARFALADLVAHRYQDVAVFLATLAELPVPELEAPPKRTRRRATRPTHTEKVIATSLGIDPEQVRQDLRQQRAQEPVTPLPKPRRRLVDDKQRATFKKDNPVCATAGPECNSGVTYSHLKKRSARGDDVDANALSQCLFHHEVYERHPQLWWDAYASRLTPEDRQKVLAIRPDLDASRSHVG